MNLIGKIVDNRYKIESLVAELEISYVFNGVDLQTNERAVTIKFLKKEKILYRSENIIRLKSAHQKSSAIDSPYIIKILDSNFYEEYYYIVSERIVGRSLKDIFSENISFSIERSLELINSIALILKSTHKHSLTVRNLIPDNLFLDEKGLIRLVNYSYYSILDVPLAVASPTIFQSLTYVSPEVCGFIKRQVDRQSDLYSLGAILYRMLTAHPPYVYDIDNKAIINSYLAASIKPPSYYMDGVPAELDRIVLKLLAREPEDRYHSIAGFLADINRFIAGERAFKLGESDSKSPLSFRTNLIGRLEERRILIEKFSEAQRGRGSICMLNGAPGMGKTRLIEELREQLNKKDCLFLRGKCYKESHEAPYLPFKEVLSDFTSIFNIYSEEKRHKTVEKIKKSTGGFGEIILRLNSSMKEILGSCAPLIELDKDKENKRFLIAVSYFLYHLADLEGTLVLFLDDLHWIDKGSLEILSELLLELKDYPVLIIATYRPDELDDNHILKKFIEENRAKNEIYNSISLSPLNDSQMAGFISELLSEQREKFTELADFVQKGSKGNPLFALEIVKQLINEKALYQKGESWMVNPEKIEHVVISNQLVELIIERTGLLNSRELEVVQYAAVIGTVFEIELLLNSYLNYPDSILNEEAIIKVIDKAIELQFLEETPYDRTRISFSHDKIREAVYNSIERDKQIKLHRRVAHTIETVYPNKVSELVYELLRHYLKVGAEDNILEYAFKSGVKAQRSYANNEAIKYYSIVLDLVTGDKSRKSVKHEMNIRETLSELYLLVGPVEQAIEFLEIILAHNLKEKEEPLQQARIYKLMLQAYALKSNWKMSERYAKKGLAILKEWLPIKKPAVVASMGWEFFCLQLHIIFKRFKIQGITELKVREPQYKTSVSIYYKLMKCYFMFDLTKVIRTTIRMVNICEQKIGSSRELSASLVAMSALYMVIPKFNKADRYLLQALKLNKRLDNKWGVGQCYINLGLYKQWIGRYEESLSYFSKSQKLNISLGDYAEASYGLDLSISSYILLGDYKKAIETIDSTLEIAQRFNNSQKISTCYYNMLKVYTHLGRFDKALEFGKKSLSFTKEHGQIMLECLTLIDLGILMQETKKESEALNYLERAKEMLEQNTFLPQYTLHLYPALVESYLAMDSKESFKRVKKGCTAGLNRATVWPSHYGSAMRANARIKEFKGDVKTARRLFLKSIEHCSNHKIAFELAKGHYYYGLFCHNNSEEALAKEEWQKALQIFSELEAEAYLAKTKELLS